MQFPRRSERPANNMANRTLMETRSLPLPALTFNELPSDTSFGILTPEAEPVILGWPTPGTANLAPRLSRAGDSRPDLDGRFQALNQSQPRTFNMRWQGDAARPPRVEWSVDLRAWTPAGLAPTHLGQGLYQWSDPQSAAEPRRYYRVVTP
jgi:hypothetical protein